MWGATRRAISERAPRTRQALVAGVGALAAIVVLAGCEGGELAGPDPADPLFERYVALGNSITAGFESGGINDSTQRHSYARDLARRMETEYRAPLLRRPGCPPPLVNVFEGTRVGGGEPECSLRRTPPPTVITNVAVPGAAVIDALTNLAPGSDPNVLTTLLLGGRTQLEAAAESRPTFASVWLGNNRVLDPAMEGSAAGLVPPGEFSDRYRQVAESLESMGVRGALLVGVVDPTLTPFFSPGVAYWQAERQGAFPPTFEVAGSCGPSDRGGAGERTLVPFGYGFGVLLRRAAAGRRVTLDCLGAGPVLSEGEIGQIRQTVAAYNGAIQAIAGERGWAFLDPNPSLSQLRERGEVPVFPNLTGEAALSAPFGEFFSRDGVHPSEEAHELIADQAATAIDETYGTDLSGGG